MITYQRSGAWKIAALVGALAAAGGAYWWFGHQSSNAQSGVVLAEKKGGLGAWMQPGVSPEEAVASLKPAVLEDGRPSDVQPDDWQSLHAALAKAGLPKSEAMRIVDYLRFQHTFESWQALDETKDASKRHQLAQALLNEIPQRLTSGEFTAIEANLMSAVLVTDVEQDETKRDARLQELQTQLNGIQPINDDNEQKVAAKTRATELKRRQATAFAEWQAKTDPADRTQAKLEQALAEVQRAYNSGEF